MTTVGNKDGGFTFVQKTVGVFDTEKFFQSQNKKKKRQWIKDKHIEQKYLQFKPFSENLPLITEPEEFLNSISMTRC